MTAVELRRADARARITEVAASLLREGGPSAVTTRGVAEHAGVQAPMIYRLFGDKDGLLEAVAEHVMAGYVASKAVVAEAASTAGTDPLTDLREGWGAQIEFGLANPTLFRLLSDPDRVRDSAAARAGAQVLRARVNRLAVAGRLRVSEQRACDLIQAAGTGTIQTLLAEPPDQRDPGLATAMLEAVLGQIMTDPTTSTDGDATASAVARRATAPAVALRAQADRLPGLTSTEQQLLTEWLDRVVASEAGATGL